jgi:hypothetical protein
VVELWPWQRAAARRAEKVKLNEELSQARTAFYGKALELDSATKRLKELVSKALVKVSDREAS